MSPCKHTEFTIQHLYRVEDIENDRAKYKVINNAFSKKQRVEAKRVLIKNTIIKVQN